MTSCSSLHRRSARFRSSKAAASKTFQRARRRVPERSEPLLKPERWNPAGRDALLESNAHAAKMATIANLMQMKQNFIPKIQARSSTQYMTATIAAGFSATNCFSLKDRGETFGKAVPLVVRLLTKIQYPTLSHCQLVPARSHWRSPPSVWRRAEYPAAAT